MIAHPTMCNSTYAASRIAATLLALLLASPLRADAVVSPQGLEEMDGTILGNPATSWPNGDIGPWPNGVRLQELHPSDGFPSSGPMTLTGLAFRPDQSVSGPVSFEWDVQINLSTTPRNSLSNTFAQNYGKDSEGNPVFTTVIPRRVVDAATDGIRDGATHGFDYVFAFDTPYTYDASVGNLVVEWIYAAAPQLSWHDMHRAAGLDLVASFDSSGATFATFRDNAVSVEQFTFVIDVYDCNGDGILTVLDANCAPAESLAETLAAANLIIGDANGDGEVQFADFVILSDNFGAAGQYTDGDFDLGTRLFSFRRPGASSTRIW